MTDLLVLTGAALLAGFVDAIVGGGGLIQTPATLITLPQHPVATLLGTTKIPSFTGTSMAAWQYARRVQLQVKLLLLMCSLAFVFALLGSLTVTVISNRFMKPVIFGVLIAVAVYTYTRKQFGVQSGKRLHYRTEFMRGTLFAALIGFYDGFIGPGAGSFLVLFFISLLHFDFLHASAHAKFVNLATNMGSIVFFGFTGHILWQYALPMALANLAGATLGTRMALLKGNQFIRWFFLAVITATIIRFGYDIFWKG